MLGRSQALICLSLLLRPSCAECCISLHLQWKITMEPLSHVFSHCRTRSGLYQPTAENKRKVNSYRLTGFLCLFCFTDPSHPKHLLDITFSVQVSQMSLTLQIIRLVWRLGRWKPRLLLCNSTKVKLWT